MEYRAAKPILAPIPASLDLPETVTYNTLCTSRANIGQEGVGNIGKERDGNNERLEAGNRGECRKRQVDQRR
jgi:hypothetical protein